MCLVLQARKPRALYVERRLAIAVEVLCYKKNVHYGWTFVLRWVVSSPGCGGTTHIHPLHWAENLLDSPVPEKAHVYGIICARAWDLARDTREF